MVTRRRLLQTAGLGAASLFAATGYAVAFERERLVVTPYDLALPRWPSDAPPLTVALIADLHAIDPWMPVARIAGIVEATNALAPDIVLLLGDFVGTMRLRNRIIEPDEWAPPLARLRAPLGAYAIRGNHDWWWQGGPEPVDRALARAGIRTLVNEAVRIERGGHAFWVTGTDSMLARRTGGAHDLPRTLAGVRDDLPILHMAHEPDLFPAMPDRVAVTFSGHTHGGQIRLPLVGPLVVPSAYGNRYAYGHVVEDGRHLVVSAGLGCSGVPARFMVPPEIVLVRIRAPDKTPHLAEI